MWQFSWPKKNMEGLNFQLKKIMYNASFSPGVLHSGWSNSSLMIWLWIFNVCFTQIISSKSERSIDFFLFDKYDFLWLPNLVKLNPPIEFDKNLVQLGSILLYWVGGTSGWYVLLLFMLEKSTIYSLELLVVIQGRAPWWGMVFGLSVLNRVQLCNCKWVCPKQGLETS